MDKGLYLGVGLILFAYVYSCWNASDSMYVTVSETFQPQYDYVVVGAGTAGSVVASRLSEDSNVKVLLLEAGENYDSREMFTVPLFWTSLLNTNYDWAYNTEPQAHAGLGNVDQRIICPRGKVIGGSGTLNAMQYTRGNRLDFDEWERNGCTGWGFKDVLPYFLKFEDMQIDDFTDSDYHRQGGPIAVSEAKATPLVPYYFNAGKELGFKLVDYNGKFQHGYSKIQIYARNGVRSSSAVEILTPASKRNNIDILTGSMATKIEFQGNVAKGLFFVREGKKHFVNVSKELIVSGGTINSPQLLMLSGVGPKEHLDKLKIPPIADLPVGENLQDHFQLIFPIQIDKPYSITPEIANSLWTCLQYSLFGNGPKSTSSMEMTAFFHLNESMADTSSTDVMILFMSLAFRANLFHFIESVHRDYNNMVKGDHGFSVSVGGMKPKSRGTIKLKTTDPFDYPSINPNYLSDNHDIKTLIGGIRIFERFLETKSFAELGVDINNLRVKSFCKEQEFRSDAYWECFIRHVGVTAGHPTSTCRMGPDHDTNSVVDTELRVKGVKGLRVIDASVFPSLVAGNTNTATIMIAEKASDIIRGVDTVKEFRRGHA